MKVIQLLELLLERTKQRARLRQQAFSRDRGFFFVLLTSGHQSRSDGRENSWLLDALTDEFRRAVFGDRKLGVC